MEARDLALLGASALFSGVDVRDLGSFMNGPGIRVQSFGAGSVVLLAGCAYRELRIILEGEAEAEMAGTGGRSTIVERFSASEAVAAAVLFSPEPVLPVSVIARTDLRLVSIPRKALLAAAAALPPVLEALLADMGSRLAIMADKYRALSFETLRERLADWLLRRAGRPADGGGLLVTLPESKERLSAGFGVARPSLSREFSWLEDHGLIRVRGRAIDILDEAGLEALRSGRGE
jgi:CRP-like cAMP-binding protein